MQINISAISNPQVRFFYSLWWPQHQIVAEFFANLAEAHFDDRLVDTPSRRSDSPRESLAHLLYVNLVYLKAVETGRLAFESLGTEHYASLSKAELLTLWEQVDQAIYARLTGAAFDPQEQVSVPWGGTMNAIDLLYFLRDHDVLHIGWNLAWMDLVDMPRFQALIQYWGP